MEAAAVSVCYICFHRIQAEKLPARLTCNHVFCQPCLKEWTKMCKQSSIHDSENHRTIICPVCLASCSYAEIIDTTDDIAKALSAELKGLNIVPRSRDADCAKCASVARHKCTTCDVHLCNVCVRTHDTGEGVTHLLVRARAEEDSLELHCAAHNIHCAQVCVSCDRAVCHRCVMTKHKNHMLNDIPATEGYRDNKANRSGLAMRRNFWQQIIAHKMTLELLPKVNMAVMDGELEALSHMESSLMQMYGDVRQELADTGQRLEARLAERTAQFRAEQGPVARYNFRADTLAPLVRFTRGFCAEAPAVELLCHQEALESRLLTSLRDPGRATREERARLRLLELQRPDPRRAAELGTLTDTEITALTHTTPKTQAG